MKIVVADSMDPVSRRLFDDAFSTDTVVHINDFPNREAKLKQQIGDANFLVVRSATKVTKELLDEAPRLIGVVRAGSGVDGIVTNECERRNIAVINTPDASTNSVAEVTVASMLSLRRRTLQTHVAMLTGRWDDIAGSSDKIPNPLDIRTDAIAESTVAAIIGLLRKMPQTHVAMVTGNWNKAMGFELAGKTIGIIDHRGIASHLAKLLQGFGVNILVYDHSKKLNGDPNIRKVELGELVRASDIVVLQADSNDETRNSIDANTIANMKDGAFFVSFAPDLLIDGEALHRALKNGKLSGAHLDVLEPGEYYTGLIKLANHQRNLKGEIINIAFSRQVDSVTLAGSTVGIVGYGRIGKCVTNLLQHFGVNIVTYDPFQEVNLPHTVGRQVGLDELLAISNVVTLHSQLTDDTRDMINARALAEMPEGAHLINFGRGGMVDENALAEALAGRKLSGAHLDVFKKEPYQGVLVEAARGNNVSFSCHIGANTVEAQQRIALSLIAQIRNVMATKEIQADRRTFASAPIPTRAGHPVPILSPVAVGKRG